MSVIECAKACDTTGWFMGDWSTALALLEKIMNKRGCSAVSFKMHDGSNFSINLGDDKLNRRCNHDMLRNIYPDNMSVMYQAGARALTQHEIEVMRRANAAGMRNANALRS